MTCKAERLLESLKERCDEGMIAKGRLTLDGDLDFLDQEGFNDGLSGLLLCRVTDLHIHIPRNNLRSPIIVPEWR